jgi:hypothetical protein
MTGEELLWRLLFRGCVLERRHRGLALVRKGRRRAIVPAHPGVTPRMVVDHITQHLGIDIRRPPRPRAIGS